MAGSDWRYQTHQFGQAQHDDKGRELGPLMAGITNTSRHRLHMCSLDFRHPNWQSMH